MAAAVHIFKTLSFDPLKDFEFGGTLLSTSFVLVVAPKDSIRTLADLTKYLKEKKGDAFYGGSTNTGIVASELYKNAIGVDVKRVNYRSAFDALNEMASGNIDFYFTDATTALGQIAAGRYRPLAVTGPKRTKALPDVPTMTGGRYSRWTSRPGGERSCRLAPPSRSSPSSPPGWTRSRRCPRPTSF
jgi:Uncharacterized protein conserved in bacteria